MDTFGVITGDLVHSRKMRAGEGLVAEALFRPAFKALQAHHKRSVLPFAIHTYRGDGWQIVTPRPALLLPLALGMRALIKIEAGTPKADTRMALAIGPIEHRDGRTIASWDGTAMHRAGAMIDQLRDTRMDFWCGNKELSDSVGVMVQLVDSLTRGWTPAQAQAAWGALRGMSQARIAERFRPRAVTQQNVQQHLRTIHWDTLDAAMEHFGKTFR
ncbi:MAG: hypothetical protein GC168_04945 [Candidatus Hydrogenedens sp.]|nr:hypothetical protein [Candidatus Hydrogenedens sp.]